MTCTYLLKVDVPYRTANFPLNILERTESKHGGMHFYLVVLVPDFANVPVVVALSIGNSLLCTYVIVMVDGPQINLVAKTVAFILY